MKILTTSAALEKALEAAFVKVVAVSEALLPKLLNVLATLLAIPEIPPLLNTNPKSATLFSLTSVQSFWSISNSVSAMIVELTTRFLR